MTFNQFIAILKARWRMVVIVLALIVVSVVALSMVWPKQYTARAMIVVNSGGAPDPINGTLMANNLLPTYIATQLGVITSDRVTRKVIRALGLDRSPEMREKWQDATDGEGSFEGWLSELLLEHLSVAPTRDSSVIMLSYTGTDPRFAAALVNSYVAAYLETNLELRVEPARQFKTMFDEQVKQARTELEAVQTRLSGYQQSKGLIANDERLDIENVRLAELSSQVTALQSLVAESKNRRAQAGSNLPEVINNAVVAGLRANIANVSAQLNEAEAKYGAAHPTVQQYKANLAELNSKLNSEIARVSSSVGVSDTVNRAREAELRAALNAQREKVLRLKEQRDEAAVMLRDVENAQRNYDLLLARYAQTNLESQNSQTNVSVLQTADPPFEPSSPRIVLNTLAAIFVGGLVGLGAALVTEILRRRVRTEDDFVNDLGVPLLGTMPPADFVRAGGKLPVRSAPRLPRRGLPELSVPTVSQ